jgi:diguanylate cyclase (GGDEF)-like protein/PAS domain S-box-containing protein
MPEERFIELDLQKLEDGSAALLIEDITAHRLREIALLQAETEYRSLFEHSVYGIYRDTLDGKPVRANPALAALNGYASEEEYITAVAGSTINWYVDADRAEEFQKMLETEGRVKDLVSEVYRHKTRERLWITENAWYVRDKDGQPVFIEGTIQDATERMQAISEIERLANCDPLTGAANRFQFLKMLRRQIATARTRLVLFCIDLDHFKEVNDTLGHAAGDFVLQTVTQRLTEIVYGKASVARLGGDEFAIVVKTEEGTRDTIATAARIVHTLNQPIEHDGHSLVVGASVGAAISPDHGTTAEELLSNADLALYQVKASGRNGHYVFDYSLKEAVSLRKEIGRELRSALENNELELYYQPIVSAQDGRIVSVEALLRWNHPRRGLLLPGNFVPVAEEAGLMSELGAWVIARACEDAKHFPDQISVSANISATQLRSPKIISQIAQTLEKTGFAPQRLELEVTETAILANQTNAQHVLAEIRLRGVRIALDDFGIGYSSLSYLQRFAFNTVKIDRSFVAGMIDQPANLAIVRAILAIGRDLGISVVAEGVETEHQLAALRTEGCPLVQGYLIGVPRSFSDTMTDLALRQLPYQPREEQEPKARSA